MAVREEPALQPDQTEATGIPAPGSITRKKTPSVVKKAPKKRTSGRGAVNSIQPSVLSFPYDVNLLKRAYTQWQFGDWESLAALDTEIMENHPDRARLALFVAAGHLQSDSVVEGKKYLKLAQDWGVSKKFACQILAAGMHNSLGRVAAIFGNKNIALKHFEAALDIGVPGDEVRLLAQARMSQQYKLIAKASQQFQSLPGYTSPVPAIESKPVTDVLGFLGMLHDLLTPRLYLQLGVARGDMFELAKGHAIGVDPLILDRVSKRDNFQLVAASSDEFFSVYAEQYIDHPPDLVVINGMPLVECTLRDFLAIERLSNPHTVVAVSGIYPRTTEQATRRRSGSDWCGDVWKLPILLKEFRQDLKIIEIDIEPYGLLLIGNLDRSSIGFPGNVNKILEEMNSLELPPDRILLRDEALESQDVTIQQFLNNYLDIKK